MGRDRNNRDHILAGAVAPEDAVCPWGLVLGVGFKNIFPIGTSDGCVFVCVESWMSRIGFQKPKGLADGFEAFSLPLVLFQVCQVLISLSRELEGIQCSLLVGIGSKAAALNQLALG